MLFMNRNYRAVLYGLAASLTGACGPVFAQQATIGVSAPLSGPAAILGEQIAIGARVAAGTFGLIVETLDDSCTPEGGSKAARLFVERKVVAVVGYLCTESLEAALPILKDAGIVAITVGVRTNAVTDKRQKSGWPVFRLAPRDDAETTAVSRIIPQMWREVPFAILDDGTIAHRDLAEALRFASEEAGLKPVLVDGFRPGLDSQATLVKRLRDIGAKAAFISGESADIAIIARAVGNDMTIAGGEQLASTNGLHAGTLMIGLPELRTLADRSALTSLEEASVLPDGYVLPTYAAFQIVTSAMKAPTATSLTERIQATDINSAVGPVRFDAKGDLTLSPYRAFAFDGRKFQPMDNP